MKFGEKSPSLKKKNSCGSRGTTEEIFCLHSMQKLCILNGNSKESDTFYRACVVKLIWRLSANFIYHVFSMKTSGNPQTNFAIIFHCLHTISILTTLVIVLPSSVFSKKTSDKLHYFSIL